MDTAEIVNRVRGLLNQYGITDGFYKDEVLYKYVDSAQMEIITFGKAKQDYIQKMDKGYEFTPLQVLIVKDLATALAAGDVEYDLPDDFLFTYSMKLDVDDEGLEYKSTLESYNEFLWKEDNSFIRATSINPRHYIRESKFGVAPTPSAIGTYSHYYYYKPPEVDSGVGVTLKNEVHNAIVWYAFSYALEQERVDSTKARQTAINLIKDM